MNIEVTYYEGGYWLKAEVRHINERSLIASLNSSRRKKTYRDSRNNKLIDLYILGKGSLHYIRHRVHSIRFPSGREWDVVNGIRWKGRICERGGVIESALDELLK